MARNDPHPLATNHLQSSSATLLYKDVDAFPGLESFEHVCRQMLFRAGSTHQSLKTTANDCEQLTKYSLILEILWPSRLCTGWPNPGCIFLPRNEAAFFPTNFSPVRRKIVAL